MAHATSQRSSLTKPHEVGTGLLGTVTGLAAFLGFLFLAVQVVVHIHATSALTSAAYEGARSVAAAPIDHGDPVAVAAERKRAEATVHEMLGRFSGEVHLEWIPHHDEIALRVRARSPSLVLGAPGGLGDIDRTVSVRIEAPR